MLLSDSDIERIDDENVGRLYMAKNKKKFPSVNKVLDFVEDKTHLLQWKERVGAEKAGEIARKASTDGGAVHKANENYFKHPGQTPTFQNTRQKHLYGQFTKFLELVETPLANELKVTWEDKLSSQGKDENGIECGYGGTLDALLLVNTNSFVLANSPEPNNRPEDLAEQDILLVDYKSQSKKKDIRWMLRHYIQAAAYIGAVNKLTDKQYSISKAMIVGATARNLYLYYLDSRSIMWYWNSWLQMLYCYFTKTSFDWETFRRISEGYLLEDNKWLFQGLNNSYLPTELKILGASEESEEDEQCSTSENISTN